MIYTLYPFPAVARLETMTLEQFCQIFDCSVTVRERFSVPLFIAHLDGIDISNGRGATPISGNEYGSGDPRFGAGETPEASIVNYCFKVAGREVLTRKGYRIRMPQIEVGALTQVLGGAP